MQPDCTQAVSHTSIEFRFKFVKVLLNSLFGLPIFRWFGRPLPIIIPVPGTTLTNILLFFRRLLGRKRQDPPKPKFEVLPPFRLSPACISIEVHRAIDSNHPALVVRYQWAACLLPLTILQTLIRACSFRRAHPEHFAHDSCCCYSTSR